MRLRFLASVILLTAGVAMSAHGEDGTWSPTDTTAQVNVACTRVYTCGPNQDVMYGGNKRLVATPNKLVWGVCSAGSGPVDSCNVCLTNPPAEKCQWHLEDR